ncbi:hybrid-cluster NAD(P)-dependent oxidoreductase [Vibrio sp. JC009]|uniref:hybrid-cluster NAD(P)-dependent oxidoreductase n=1 Tax=Vibrio sp. JC009 TaxID=2912314 RepID=UPI0023AE96CA|nr:hybrid-cluster NAD(P)-dependent oxidoreductase [Vibrio sp. JC009]WED24325.1 hybrid-cluster NAD(P)-dependent oxidoreductase [Vibrio sp. JC009]
MSKATLSQINVYPIKSVQGLSLSSSWVEKQGLSFDRRFMLAKGNGAMVTARTHPQLVRVSASLLTNAMVVSFPGKESLRINYSEFEQKEQNATVWKDSFTAYSTTEEANNWFSEVLGEPVQLLYSGEQSNRHREKLGHSVSFADGYPLLIVSRQSLEELNRRCPEEQSMSQFRPNLVVDGSEPFVEDRWKRIKIGEVEFEIRKPCERCVLTTVDPETGKFCDSKEPLATLATFRANEVGGTFFGQNIVALNEGMIREGDTVEVLETKPKEQYLDKSDDKLKLTCVCVEEVAQNFVTYWLEPLHGELPPYLPGQHLPISIKDGNETYTRKYTLSSSPSRPGRYAISVKRINGGKVSNWIADNFKVGGVLTADSPQGSFHLDTSPVHPLLLISAGSGVTPMISMLRYLADQDLMQDVVFYHQCSTVQDIPFKEELDELNHKFEGLKVIVSLSQADEDWDGLKGRIELTHLKPIPELGRRQAFVCGPVGFMQKAKKLLLNLGLDESRYHQEMFGIELETDGEEVALSLTIDGQQIRGENKTPLLLQAESAGLNIINSCRAGFCGACKMTLKSGEVVQPDVPALTDEERIAGKVLACCCIPKTDIEVSS